MVHAAIKTASGAGRRVEYVSGNDHDVISDAVSASVLYPEPILMVVSEPKGMDPELVREHVEGDDNTVALLLVSEGNVPGKGTLSEIAEGIPKKYLVAFKKPSPYKQEEASISFVMKEAQQRGKRMPESVALALVKKVGTEFGVLYYEVMKVAAYMEAIGAGEEVTADHLRATVLQVGSVDNHLKDMVTAVGHASPRRVLRSLDAIQKDSGQDATMRTLAWLGGQATKWLHAASLDSQGAGENEGASRMGMSPYVYSSIILPVSRRWGVTNLKTLVHRLAHVEVSIKSGKINPWIQLECALVASCQAVRSAR